MWRRIRTWLAWRAIRVVARFSAWWLRVRGMEPHEADEEILLALRQGLMEAGNPDPWRAPSAPSTEAGRGDDRENR